MRKCFLNGAGSFIKNTVYFRYIQETVCQRVCFYEEEKMLIICLFLRAQLIHAGMRKTFDKRRNLFMCTRSKFLHDG